MLQINQRHWYLGSNCVVWRWPLEKMAIRSHSASRDLWLRRRTYSWSGISYYHQPFGKCPLNAQNQGNHVVNATIQPQCRTSKIRNFILNVDILIVWGADVCFFPLNDSAIINDPFNISMGCTTLRNPYNNSNPWPWILASKSNQLSISHRWCEFLNHWCRFPDRLQFISWLH